MPASRPRFRRGLKRSLVAAGLVALLGALWFLFLPVPLTWAARLALRLTLPPDRDFASVRIDHVTFRFRFLQPSIQIDLDGIAVQGASGGQLARRIKHVEVRFAKRALWRRNWAPSLVAVSQPVLFIDLTQPGVPTPPSTAPNMAPASPSPSTAVRTAALRAFIPLPDNPCRFVIKEPSVEIKSPGRDAHWLFQDIDTVFSRHGDNLNFEFPIALANTRRPVGLTCRIEGALQTGLINFSVSPAGFSSEDLPPGPLLPGKSERSKFRIAFSVDGRLRLDQLRIEEINFSLLADEGEFHLPRVKSTPIHVRRVEIRGRARDDFRFIHLDAAVLALDSLRLDASGLDAETGPSPRVTGTASGDLQASLPLAAPAELAAIDAKLQTRIDGLIVPLTFPGARLGGGQLVVSAQSLRGQLSTTVDWRALDLTLPDVLTGRPGPGRMSLTCAPPSTPATPRRFSGEPPSLRPSPRSRLKPTSLAGVRSPEC